MCMIDWSLDCLLNSVSFSAIRPKKLRGPAGPSAGAARADKLLQGKQ